MPSTVAMGSGAMFSEREIKWDISLTGINRTMELPLEISILLNSTFKQLTQTFFWHPLNHRDANDLAYQ